MGGQISRGIGTGIGTSTGDNPVAGIVSLGVAGVSIWALVCAARMTISAVGFVLGALANGGPIGLGTNVLQSAVGGAFAGVAIIILRNWSRRHSAPIEPFLSAVFGKHLGGPAIDRVFLGRVVLGGFVGFLVGALHGGQGILSFPQFLFQTTADVLSQKTYPIMVLVGGGFGGPGGTGFWSLAFLILVIVVAAVLSGLVIALLVHLALAIATGTLTGSVKGGVKAYVVRLLDDRSDQAALANPHPIVSGMARGALVGLIVGVVEAAFTAWGVGRSI